MRTGTDGVLTLDAVHVEPVEHVHEPVIIIRMRSSGKHPEQVNSPDEELRDPHSLQEIGRALHLGHEVGEDISSAIRENCVHDTIERSNEAASWRDIGVMLDRRPRFIRQLIDTPVLQRCSSTENPCSVVVGVTMRGNNHGEDHDEDVHEDCYVGQPSEFLQCSDLAEKHAGHYEDDDADDVAELEFGDDGQSQAVRDCDQGNGQDQLDRLQDVDWDTSSLAVAGRITLAGVLDP